VIVRSLKIAASNFRMLSPGQFARLFAEWAYQDYPVLIYALEELPGCIDESEGGDGIEICKGDIAELDAVHSPGGLVPWEFQCHCFDGVRDFFVAKHSTGIRHISWIYYQGHPNKIVKLGRWDAEVKYSLTLPGFRGRGLFPRVLTAAAEYLHGKGFHRVCIGVREDNPASIRGIEKAGFKPVGRICLRKAAGVRLSRRFCPDINA
jgi:GNAT superfamily N-acetyltransferase